MTAPSSAPVQDPISYEVVSVDGEEEYPYCVTAEIKVFNNGATAILVADDNILPNPFILVNAAGDRLWDTEGEITLDGDILPGEWGHGGARFCAGGINEGDRVTFHHGDREWDVRIPKSRPTPEEDEPEESSGSNGGGSGSGGGGSDGDDGDSGGGGGGGAYPGYTGPRCYAPGGKTWRPC